MVVQHYSDPMAYGLRELRMLEYVSSQVARSIDRKRAEAAVRASETTLRVFIDALPGPAMLLDREETVLEANEAMAQSLGRSRAEIVGEKAFALLPPEAGRLRRGRFIRCLEIEKPVVFEDERGGRSFLNYLYPVLNQNRIVTRVALYAIDMTARKEAEKALHDSEELHRRLVAAVPDLIIRTDLAGTIVFANDIAIRMSGLGPAQSVIGRNVFDFVAPEDRDKAVRASRLMTEKKIGPQEITLAFADKGRVQFEIDGAVLRHPDGTPYGIVYLCRDITERKRAETSLREGLAKLRSTLKASIDSLASAIEMRDPYTAGHQERVTRLARAIAVEMGLSEDRVEAIEIAGVIHDLGKLYVPAEILSKPTKLTELEYAMIKMHAQAGYTILSKIDFPWPIAQIVHQHHELVNGSGYPQGLTGKEILLEARILCVADVVEAMSSHRPYRPSLGVPTALEEIAQKRGILYDREVVDACLRLFREKSFKFD
jgi:PAS domain S-box-containing protein